MVREQWCYRFWQALEMGWSDRSTLDVEFAANGVMLARLVGKKVQRERELK